MRFYASAEKKATFPAKTQLKKHLGIQVLELINIKKEGSFVHFSTFAPEPTFTTLVQSVSQFAETHA